MRAQRTEITKKGWNGHGGSTIKLEELSLNI